VRVEAFSAMKIQVAIFYVVTLPSRRRGGVWRETKNVKKH
jgi:hypothetical protein